MVENVRNDENIGEFVNRLIEDFPKEKREKFGKFFNGNLYNRGWCRRNGVDYVNPNILDAKIKAYEEFVRFSDAELKEYFD